MTVFAIAFRVRMRFWLGFAWALTLVMVAPEEAGSQALNETRIFLPYVGSDKIDSEMSPEWKLGGESHNLAWLDNRYLLISENSQLLVLDTASNPPLAEIGRVRGLGVMGTQLAVSGQTAFVPVWDRQELAAIDLGKPNRPLLRNGIPMTKGLHALTAFQDQVVVCDGTGFRIHRVDVTGGLRSSFQLPYEGGAHRCSASTSGVLTAFAGYELSEDFPDLRFLDIRGDGEPQIKKVLSGGFIEEEPLRRTRHLWYARAHGPFAYTLHYRYGGFSGSSYVSTYDLRDPEAIEAYGGTILSQGRPPIGTHTFVGGFGEMALLHTHWSLFENGEWAFRPGIAVEDILNGVRGDWKARLLGLTCSDPDRFALSGKLAACGSPEAVELLHFQNDGELDHLGSSLTLREARSVEAIGSSRAYVRDEVDRLHVYSFSAEKGPLRQAVIQDPGQKRMVARDNRSALLLVDNSESGGSGLLQVLDLRDPRKPHRRGKTRPSLIRGGFDHTRLSATRSSALLIRPGLVEVYDLRDIDDPRRVAAWPLSEVNRTSDSLIIDEHAFYIDGVFSVEEGGLGQSVLVEVNLEDPKRPRVTARRALPLTSSAPRLAQVGDHLVIVGSGGEMHSLDMGTLPPDGVQIAPSDRLQGHGRVNALSVLGHRLFISDPDGILRVVSIDQFGRFQKAGRHPMGVSLGGVANVDGLLWLASGQSGVQILRPGPDGAR